MESAYSPEAMRARFAELVVQRDAIRAVVDPLREARDAHVQAARATEDEMNEEIRTASEGLYEIDQEIGVLTRALNGKTAEPEAAEE